MKKYLLLYGFALVSFTGCKGDIFVPNKTVGTVTLKDDYLETDAIIAPVNTEVLLGKNPDYKTYFDKKITDKEGNFKFEHLPNKADSYWVKSTLTLNDITYSDRIGRKSESDNNLVLKPTYRDGIKVKVTRFNEPVNGIKVYLFINKAQADSARKAPADDKIIGYIANPATTNLKGVALFPNLPNEKYYIYVRLQFKSDTILSDTKAPSNMKDTNIEKVILN